jgi:hypothetical protein
MKKHGPLAKRDSLECGDLSPLWSRAELPALQIMDFLTFGGRMFGPKRRQVAALQGGA